MKDMGKAGMASKEMAGKQMVKLFQPLSNKIKLIKITIYFFFKLKVFILNLKNYF